MNDSKRAARNWREGAETVLALQAELDSLKHKLQQTGLGNRATFQEAATNLKELCNQSHQLDLLLDTTKLVDPHHPYHFAVTQSLRSVQQHSRATYRRLCQAAMKQAINDYEQDVYLDDFLSLAHTLSISLGQLRKALGRANYRAWTQILE